MDAPANAHPAQARPQAGEPPLPAPGAGPTWETPVQFLKGVGPGRAEVFAQLGVRTVGDLLEYYPRDWIFSPDLSAIGDLRADQTVAVRGLVESVDYQAFRRTPLFEVLLADATGVLRLVWFRGGYLQKQVHPGQCLIASGKVTAYRHQLQMTNPKFSVVQAADPEADARFGGGVYPATAKLSSDQIKRVVRPLLVQMGEQVEEYFDPEILRDRELIPRGQALTWIHDPPDPVSLSAAQRRLKYDELFLMQLGLALRRYRTRHLGGARAMTRTETIDRHIRRRFPFLLTADQDAVIEDIVRDMGRAEPMNRLVQGDVGSGKTVVALYAALLAVAHRTQVAIMAPTEILAGQHFLSIERYLRHSRVRRALITGALTGAERRAQGEAVAAGDLDLVVGTVALVQGDLRFRDLGLVVIDEQHKFGVAQRGHLRKDGCPHCLVMTATPIPRTLAMTAFGDLDVSIIGHAPPGRGQVVTRLVDPAHRDAACDFIRQRLQAGKQAYFVYPRITATEGAGEVRAATDEWQRLSREVFPEFRVALLHGRLSAEEKQSVMDDFRAGRIQVLVSTVVIEVGVDVPNATIMVIEGADRFGLAQLHQLRGRIGRGASKSTCLLFAETENAAAQERLAVMTRTHDGFEIAEQDLRLRGPGELFSTRQHGLPDLKIANIIEDHALLGLARRDAFALVEDDPHLAQGRHQSLRRALLAKFGAALGLGDVG